MNRDEARNIRPAWSEWRFWAYFCVVVGGGLAVVGYSLAHFSPITKPAILVIAALVVISEVRPLFTPNLHDTHGLTTTPCFMFALLLVCGLPHPVVLLAIAIMIADRVMGRAYWRSLFNIGQYSLCYLAAALVLRGLGHGSVPGHPLPLTAGTLPALTAAAAAYLIANELLVGGMCVIYERMSPRKAFVGNIGEHAVTTGSQIALSPLVVLAVERSAWLVPLIVVPLLAVYKAVEITRTQQARDLRDDLTGLPNRKMLLNVAEESLETARRLDHVVGLCVLDLNRFKEINDTLGHEVGDQVLREVAERLTRTVGGRNMVARLGGDEYAVLLPTVTDTATATAMAVEVTRCLGEPLQFDALQLDLDASIGIAVAPQHAADVTTLLQRAEVAMYVAKERGVAHEVYTADADTNSTARLGLLGDLRRALDTPPLAIVDPNGNGNGQVEPPYGGLELHYQPKARLLTGQVTGVEALIRWQHPTRGLIAPDRFIPIVERTALIHSLTRWVIDTALGQLACWEAAGLGLRVAVNVSARDLYGPDLAGFLAARLAHHGVRAHLLQLEITEGVLMADPGRALSTIRQLEDLGLSLSLDDFGTGYSSLTNLRRLPVNEIKIDRSFVRRMDVNSDDATIVRSIIDLGAALGLRVVAEGVETRQTWQRLGDMGCDEAQGWYLAQSLPVAAATTWLREHVTGNGHRALQPADS
ncbi:MAG: putative bifunctional diguanylate cyclase/phosphodiesterase [Mycobacteriales bacterium]